MIEASDMHEVCSQFEMVKGIDLRVDEGEVLSIIGGSGSGKSTLLMCIDGLEPIRRGSARVDGINAHARGTDLSRLRRKVNIVFQQWNASPHLTVLESIVLAPRRVLDRSRAEAEVMVLKQLTHIGFSDKLKVFPQRLSGGQQQRMAITRALAMSPDYMLLDEAISALGLQLVGEILDAMCLLAKEGMTIVLVTHKIRFAHDVSDWMAFFRNGPIHRIGTPDQMIGDPQRPKTVEFLRLVL